jgi:O-antigen ligase
MAFLLSGLQLEKIERRVIGVLLALLSLAQLIPFFTDVNHPPGMRWIRMISALAVAGLGVCEWRKPCSGLALYLLLWPHFLVFKELLSKAHPYYSQMPFLAGAPAAAALGAGIWLRAEWNSSNAAGRDASRADGMVKFLAGFRVALWLLALSLAASVGPALRDISARPEYWNTHATDLRHLLNPGPFSNLLPLLSACELLPPLLLGLLLLNMLAGGHRHVFNAAAARLALQKAMIFGGLLLAVEVASQLAFDWSWAFNVSPAAGSFPNHNTTAAILVVMAGVIWAHGSTAQPRLIWLCRVLPVLIVLLAVLEKSRNSILGGICLVVFVLLNRPSVLRTALAALVLVAVYFAAKYAPLPPASRDIHLRAAARASESLQAWRKGDWNTASGQRLGMYLAAWEIHKAHPVWGSGPSTYRMLSAKGAPHGKHIEEHEPGGIVSHAHSVPMQWLAETGFQGVIAWGFAWLLLPFAALLCRKKSGIWALPLLLAGATSLFDAASASTSVFIFFILLIVVACQEFTAPDELIPPA